MADRRGAATSISWDALRPYNNRQGRLDKFMIDKCPVMRLQPGKFIDSAQRMPRLCV